MKKIFGEGGIKGFLAHHVEKIVLSVVALVGLMIIWSGFSNRVGIRPDYDPSTLVQKVNSAEQNIQKSTWADYRDERATELNFRERAQEARQEINTASFKIEQPLKPPYQPPRTMRTDPQLYAASDLQVRTGFAAITKSDRSSERSDRNAADNIWTEQPGTRPPGESGRGEEELAENERRIPAAYPGGGGAERGPRGRGMGEKKGKYFVVVTALIPYRKQLEEYNECLANSNGYDPARDMPNYDNWILERAEVTGGREPQWKAIASRGTAFKVMKNWGVAMDRRGSGSMLVSPKFTDPALTMPLLEFDMGEDELDDLMRHMRIDKYEAGRNRRNGERRPGGERRRGDGESASLTDEETGLDMSTPMNVPGLNGPGREGAGLSREGGYPRSREAVGGYPSGERRGGFPSGERGGFAGGERGGYSGGEGSFSQSFSLGQIPDPKDFPEYKMFRFIDMNVKPNAEYQYRLELRLEDPNDPNVLQKQAPAASTLEPTVLERLTKRPAPPAWVTKMGLKRIYFRETEKSEPSPIVKVTDGRQLIVGEIEPADTRTAFPRPGDEPKAKVMALEFDDQLATNVPGIFEAYRGTVGNIKMDVEVPYWSEGILRKEENHQFRVNATVLDLEGGRSLLKDSDLTVPGEMLVMRDGRLSVVDELESARLFERFDFPPPQKDNEREGARSDNPYGGEPRGGEGREGGRRGAGSRRRGGEGGLFGEGGAGGRRPGGR